MFFALWPEPEVQASLLQLGRELQRGVGGKLTRQASIHLTLAFLGDVDLDRMEEIRSVGARAAFQPFVFAVDTAGCWGHNGVAWLGPRLVPEALLALVGSLKDALQESGFRVDQRPYAAHATVVRKARCKPIELTPAPVEWWVNDFVLVRSQLGAQGSRYTVVGRWPDANAGAGQLRA
jgi:2'-5' RNA ligase